MNRSLLLLALISGSAWATPFEHPNTAGCRDKFDKVPCRADNDAKGTCVTQQLNTPDFSQPGPPKFNQVATRVCVATPSTHSAKDYAAVVVAALVVFALIIYNLFRRRTLSDYL